jgi:hypothetical protein
VFQKVNKEFPEKTPKISYIPKEDELKLLWECALHVGSMGDFHFLF